MADTARKVVIGYGTCRCVCGHSIFDTSTAFSCEVDARVARFAGLQPSAEVVPLAASTDPLGANALRLGRVCARARRGAKRAVPRRLSAGKKSPFLVQQGSLCELKFVKGRCGSWFVGDSVIEGGRRHRPCARWKQTAASEEVPRWSPCAR